MAILMSGLPLMPCHSPCRSTCAHFTQVISSLPGSMDPVDTSHKSRPQSQAHRTSAISLSPCSFCGGNPAFGCVSITCNFHTRLSLDFSSAGPDKPSLSKSQKQPDNKKPCNKLNRTKKPYIARTLICDRAGITNKPSYWHRFTAGSPLAWKPII